jgi:ubiquinone/menaquinone biosynthesis C-methylase UbiE
MNKLTNHSVYRAALNLSLGFYLCASNANLNTEESIANTVDHKNLNLSFYLDKIKYNTQEKLGILPYILANPNGVYLEIGTGGDPIAELLSRIPNDLSPTIIASDVDENILKILPTRHPQLNKYLTQKSTGAKLQLQQLDATSMGCFPDNYLSGINASAVVHEIISYAGGIDGFDKFFAESFRILKKDGILTYRDPESVPHKNESILANFKTPTIRLFTHIFLIKFLDNIDGSLAATGRKYKHYDTQNIVFTIYKKNETNSCKLNYQEYMQLRTYEIDFSRPYMLQLPRGLCREIERHYLTYLHDCNPLVFIKCTPIVGSELYTVNYLANSSSNVLNDFLQKHGLSLTVDGKIDTKTHEFINIQINNNIQALEYGILLHLVSKRSRRQLCMLLKEHNLDPNLYIIQIKEDEYLLDYRIFGLLYDDISNQIFNSNDKPINLDDTIHAQWLKREGEETYIYYSDDELITKVAEISLKQSQGNQERLILCPLSPTHNKFIPRLCYNDILKNSLDLNNAAGYHIKIKEGKRIIHFSKMPLDQALAIYTEIIKTKPHRYTHLQKFVDTIKV